MESVIRSASIPGDDLMNLVMLGRSGLGEEPGPGKGGGMPSSFSPYLSQLNTYPDGGGDDHNLQAVVGIEREHMFDKVVTPSDVGKLNRLVIPKQHAEKYFPLDSSTNEKGLLLNFEDTNGKQWRFRYSYWNSSQSYVMTKGWSRFVKEKKLDAGDVVSFQRGVGEQRGKDRLFIDWRRRPDAIPILPHKLSLHNPIIPPWSSPHFCLQLLPPHHHHNYTNGHAPDYVQYGGAVINGNPCLPPSPSGSPITYLRSAPAGFGQQQALGLMHAQGGEVGLGVVNPMVFESVPVVQGKTAAKRLRLFGVNMDCPISESVGCDSDILSSSTTLPQYPHSSTTPFIHHLLPPPPPFDSSSSSSSSPSPNPNPNPNPLQLNHPSSNYTHDKGKGTSMSLDLGI